MAKRPKKPKMPRITASIQVWERYEQRVKDWRKKIAQIEAEKKRKAAIIQRVRKMTAA